MRESGFQKALIDEIKERLPGAYVYKNESYTQGFPDLTVLYGSRWATLECKKNEKAAHQPNQDYYVRDMNEKSFSAVIYPENKEEVLDDMERSLKVRRVTCVSRSK